MKQLLSSFLWTIGTLKLALHHSWVYEAGANIRSGMSIYALDIALHVPTYALHATKIKNTLITLNLKNLNFTPSSTHTSLLCPVFFNPHFNLSL